jgi:hypothetical protein
MEKFLFVVVNGQEDYGTDCTVIEAVELVEGTYGFDEMEHLVDDLIFRAEIPNNMLRVEGNITVTDDGKKIVDVTYFEPMV